jgi:hypothetical protein
LKQADENKSDAQAWKMANWYHEFIVETAEEVKAEQRTHLRRMGDPCGCDDPELDPEFGNEIMYQTIQEGLNEMLNNLFQWPEDIAMAVDGTSVERWILKEIVNDFLQQPDNLEACQASLARFNESGWKDWGRRHGDENLRLGRKAADFLKTWCSEEAKQGTFEYYLLLIDTCHYVEDKRMLELKAMPPTTHGYEALQRKLANLINKLNETKAITEADSKKEPSVLPELVFDPSHPKSSFKPLESIQEFQNAVQRFDELDLSDEDKILKTDLDTLIKESGYSIIEDDDVKAGEVATTEGTAYRDRKYETEFRYENHDSETPDPTLPQNRPNRAADYDGPAELETFVLVPPSRRTNIPPPPPPPLDINDPEVLASADAVLRDTPEWKSRIKYYAILELIHRENGRRGGGARLNLKEFEEIMNQPIGTKLDFLYGWIEMTGF